MEEELVEGDVGGREGVRGALGWLKMKKVG